MKTRWGIIGVLIGLLVFWLAACGAILRWVDEGETTTTTISAEKPRK